LKVETKYGTSNVNRGWKRRRRVGGPTNPQSRPVFVPKTGHKKSSRQPALDPKRIPTGQKRCDDRSSKDPGGGYIQRGPWGTARTQYKRRLYTVGQKVGRDGWGSGMGKKKRNLNGKKRNQKSKKKNGGGLDFLKRKNRQGTMKKKEQDRGARGK